MTQSNLIRLSGWGMVVAAISLLLTFSDMPIAFLVANVLITAGLWGLYARYGNQAGIGVKVALGLGMGGGIAAAVTSLLLTIGYENVRPVMNNGMAVMFLGLFMFGVISLRTKPMPHGNFLPLLAGFMWPFIVIGTTIYHGVTGEWLHIPYWLSFTLFCIMGIFLGWLGYILQAEASSEAAPV